MAFVIRPETVPEGYYEAKVVIPLTAGAVECELYVHVYQKHQEKYTNTDNLFTSCQCGPIFVKPLKTEG